jgi:hypothetical protein
VIEPVSELFGGKQMVDRETMLLGIMLIALVVLVTIYRIIKWSDEKSHIWVADVLTGSTFTIGILAIFHALGK